MPVLRRFACLLGALLGVPDGPVYAQPEHPRFACYGVEDGLPSATVTSILQDRQGFLWVGTGRGLVRFDGHAFRRYTVPGESLGEVAALLETSDGTLWAGTNHTGLFRIDARTDRLRRASPPLPGVIEQMEEGPGGRLLLDFDDGNPEPEPWIILDGTGQRRPFRLSPAHKILNVFRDATGHLWVLREDGAVYRLAPGARRWQRVPLRGVSGPIRPGGSSFFALGAQPALRRDDGRVWIPAGDTLVPHPSLPPTLPLTRPASATRSGAGLVLDGVWWSSWDQLTAWHPDRGRQTYGPVPGDPHALPDTRVLSVIADHSGGLWIGTSSRGLCRLDPSADPLRITSLLSLHPGAHADRLYTVYASPHGETFLGLEGTLLVRARAARRFQPWRPPLPDAGAPLFSKAIFRDRRGRLWVSQWGGKLWRLDAPGARWRGYTYGENIDFGAARVMHEDRRGRLWVGSEAGLRRYLPDRDTFIRPRASGRDALVVARVPVWTLHEAADGTFWVGTYQHGLCHFDPETSRERCYRVGATAPSSGSISSVRPGPPGQLWVGTYGGGLCQFTTTTGASRCRTEADGLLHDVVYALLPDARGHLWMSTQGGISRFDPAAGTFQNFRLDQRAPRLELSNGVGARLTSGHFIFGGVGGLVQFHPDSVEARRYRPPVRLTNVRFFDRDIAPDASEWTGEGLRVPHAERFLSFEFAALDLLAPERLRYRYRLDGFDPGWSEASAQRTATYTNLPPGEYTFEVRATNAAGLWNAETLHLPVVVVPPLWMRGWVRALAGILLALGFGVAVRYASTRRLRARLHVLEAERRVQAERLRISRDLHDHVGAQMATVLSAAELVRLSARAGDDDGAQRYADVVASDAREAMQQLRIAVDSLRAEALTARELAARIEAYARARLRLPGSPALHFALEAGRDPDDVLLAPAQALQLFRIAQEAVSNVLRHAAATRLEIVLHVGPGCVRLAVQDDGAGFAPDLQRSGDGLPTGNGLRNMRARAEEVGGRFAVQAAPEAGTRIEVEIPFR